MHPKTHRPTALSSFTRRTLMLSLVAAAALGATVSAAGAQVHAACGKCGIWVVISNEGAGFARNHCVLCGTCLQRANQETRDEYQDLSKRIDEKKRNRRSYKDAVANKTRALNDHVNRERADHESRGFGYDQGWIRTGEGKRKDDRHDRLAQELVVEQRKSNTLNQQIKELDEKLRGVITRIP